jgi:hypothetical protein
MLHLLRGTAFLPLPVVCRIFTPVRFAYSIFAEHSIIQER